MNEDYGSFSLWKFALAVILLTAIIMGYLKYIENRNNAEFESIRTEYKNKIDSLNSFLEKEYKDYEYIASVKVIENIKVGTEEDYSTYSDDYVEVEVNMLNSFKKETLGGRAAIVYEISNDLYDTINRYQEESGYKELLEKLENGDIRYKGLYNAKDCYVSVKCIYCKDKYYIKYGDEYVEDTEDRYVCYHIGESEGKVYIAGIISSNYYKKNNITYAGYDSSGKPENSSQKKTTTSGSSNKKYYYDCDDEREEYGYDEDFDPYVDGDIEGYYNDFKNEYYDMDDAYDDFEDYPDEWD
ncbi:MAG: hypothetical protein K6B41_09385 [Butyrivibrio sp.]|nr:hypothetical protein [Butyrivibrio sp.]